MPYFRSKEKLPEGELKERISNARRSGRLQLHRRNMKEIPEEILKAEHIKELLLSWNSFHQLDNGLSAMKQLKLLYLSNNTIFSFPTVILQLTDLEELSLASNVIAEIPAEVAEMKSLKTLYLSDNRLTTFPSHLLTLPNLEVLELDDNQIKDIPKETLEVQTGIRRLTIRNNKLSDLPPTLYTMKEQLKDTDDHGLELAGNPFKYALRMKFNKEGMKGIWAYLKDKHDDYMVDVIKAKAEEQDRDALVEVMGNEMEPMVLPTL